MFSKTFQTIAGLTFALALTAASRPAAAQPVTFWVSATAATNGYPGTSNHFTGALNNQTWAYAESDPAGLQFGQNAAQQLYADVGAHSSAAPAELHAQTSLHALRINAGSFPSSPTASTEGRFVDAITVVGLGIPNGTPVTLTFRNTIDVAWQGTSLYDGYVSSNTQIGAVSASSRWDVAYNKTLLPVLSPQLLVKTTVGSRLQLGGRLNTFARGSYFVPGPSYDGTLDLDVTATLRLESATADVTLVADSGADYNPIAN